MMPLVLFLLISMMTTTTIHGCISMSSDTTSNPSFYDSHAILKEEYEEVWQGSVDFFDFFCGIPETSYRSNKPDGKRRRRRDASDDIDINNYSLDHSLVLFRGKCFEFGPGRELFYLRGGVGRSAESCPVTWTRMGRSRCTVEEVEEIAALHQAESGYHLLWNNCHHFTEWLLRKLVSNQCSVPSDDNMVDEIEEKEDENIKNQQA